MIYKSLDSKAKSFTHKGKSYKHCLLVTTDEAKFLRTLMGMSTSTGVHVTWNDEQNRICKEIFDKLYRHFKYLDGIRMEHD